MADRPSIAIDAPPGGWPPPWQRVAELEAGIPRENWTLIGGLMVQVHAAAHHVGAVRPTNDVDLIVHVETRRGRPAKVASALRELGYQLTPGLDPRTATAHRFTRDSDVVDVVMADHAAPRVHEQLDGYDMVTVAGGTQALRRTMDVRLSIRPDMATTISVPDPFGALILKAAAHKGDSRDRERHLSDAAVLLACIDDPFAPRAVSGGDRARLRYLQRQLSDPRDPAWMQLSEKTRSDAQTALAVLTLGTTGSVARREGHTLNTENDRRYMPPRGRR